MPTSTTPEAAVVPLSRHSLLAAGLSDLEIARMVRSGQLARIRWGAYRAGAGPQYAEDQHRELIRATVDRFRIDSDVVVSHISAAILHGAPVRGVDLSKVHVTRPGRSGASSSGAVHPHRGRLLDDEVTVIHDIPVTSPARTALDVARSCPFTPAVIVVDGLLHLGLMSGDELTALIDRARRKGVARGAVRVGAFADGRSESPAESHSRVVLAGVGLPIPRLQAVVLSSTGMFVARTDFEMEGFATVAECDGVSKYVRYLRPGETIADAVIREKRREDEIRSHGREMVRWIPAELRQPGILLARFARAFARAGFPDWRPGPCRVPTPWW